MIEKWFSQFKTDFEVAPVYLKEVTRIQALMAIYFFVLMVQTLLKREFPLALDGSDSVATVAAVLHYAHRQGLGFGSLASRNKASQVATSSTGSIAAFSASVGLGASDRQPIKIVPKGLRSFDAHDADFFLAGWR